MKNKPADHPHARPHPSVPALAACLLVAACGGGGGGSTSEGEQERTLAGIAIDGVSFETATLSGVTRDGGRFRSMPKERVRFFLGGTDLSGIAHPKETLPTSNLRIRQALDRDGSYIRLVNSVRVLMTLDGDGDSANGLAISPEVAALFGDISVDTNRDVKALAHDSGFRTILNKAKEMELLPADTRVPTLGRTLEAIYSGHEIAQVAFARSRQEESYSAGNGLEIRSVSLYDMKADGTLSREIDNWPLDGITDSASFVFFDDNGRVVGQGRREHGEEGITLTAELAYDDHGDLARERSNHTTVAYVNDFRGLPIHASYESTSGVAWTGSWEYNERGDVVRESTESEVNSLIVNEYDEIGRLVRHETHKQIGASDENRSIATLEYDDLGNLKRKAADDDGDGTVDRVDRIEYDSRGFQVLRASDWDADGIEDSETTLHYDARHDLIETVYTYSHKTKREVIERDGSSNPVGLRTYRDGVLSHVVQLSYDAHGNPLVEEEDYNADGVIDRVIAWGWQPGNWDRLLDSPESWVD